MIFSKSTDLSDSNASFTKRIASIDLLRGLVIILMALDHTRIFFTNVTFNPLTIEQTNLPLYLTRWITHICATSFIFLAGVSIYLALKRGKNRKTMGHFLLLRGLWLIILELTIIKFAWLFSPDFFLAGVIWVIGWSMIILAFVIKLPTRIIGILAIFMILGHNILDSISADSWENFSFFWSFLHERKLFTTQGNIQFFLVYPLVPWVGVMALGYVFGPVFTWQPEKRFSFLKKTSLFLLISFLVLRGLNIYGDPKPWSQQSTLLKTFFSFWDCYKYPPSLLYLLITLSITLILLYLFERYPSAIFYPLKIFGQVPLFFYILHLWLIHLAAIVFALPKYGYQAVTIPYFIGSLKPENYGYDLHHVYLFWILILAILYPSCYWFNQYKAKHKFWWLKFL